MELADGYNTRQVLNYSYRSWREFFNDRQLLALGWLRQAILELPDDAVRAAMLTTFSGALEFNNMFASYKGEGTGAIRHMFAHHILKPERVPIEGHVWGTSKSSGSFSTLFRSRLLRAIEYQAAPFEVGVECGSGRNGGRRVYGASLPFTGVVSTYWPPGKPADRSICLSCGSSAHTGLPGALQRAVEVAADKAARLKDCGLVLSANDRRVVVISQFLVEACAGRSAEQLADALSSSLNDLDLAAMRLIEAQPARPTNPANQSEMQLVLFEQAQAKRSKRSP